MMRDCNESMCEFADNLADYIWKKHISPKLARSVEFYRATVKGAADGGKIRVQRPFDNQIVALPYVGSAAGLNSGQQCVVLVLGSQSNSIVIGDGTLSNL